MNIDIQLNVSVLLESNYHDAKIIFSFQIYKIELQKIKASTFYNVS